nr:citrate lyase subunit alpha [Thermovirga lienii]
MKAKGGDVTVSRIMNAKGRTVPTRLFGWEKAFEPYQGPFTIVEKKPIRKRASAPMRGYLPGRNKVAESLKKAIEASGLSDGMTISFHHHLRNGDAVLPMVLDVIASMGIKNLTLAPSSLTDAHQCVVDHIRSGVISRITTSGLRGKLGEAISYGELPCPVIIRSHGGRARAIEEGSINIDVAFIAAPSADREGNVTGAMGPEGCGSLGYAMVDAKYARHVIAITDNLVPYPLVPKISIPQNQVDQVVVVDKIGDSTKIATGAARITKNPVDLRIAKNAFDLICASGLLEEGFSFQVGVGGASLAVASFLREYMIEKNIKGGFGLGGIGGYMVELLREGLFEALFDVQSFDASVTESILNNPLHIEIDQSQYANPFVDCMVNLLDVVALAALDVDVDFNVNVLTGNDGIIRGASGGHCDTAAGAKLAVVLAPSFRGGIPTIKDRVQTIVTPGETVDAIVTERGICINPRREDLLERALKANLPVKDIGKLKEEVERLTGKPKTPEFDEEKIVAVVEYRDGTLIDSVYARKR